jgi:hypothetical protein
MEQIKRKSNADRTHIERGERGRFRAGVSANPKGRPLGAKRKLPPGCPQSAAARRWHRTYGAMRALAGPDPEASTAAAAYVLDQIIKRTERSRRRVVAAPVPVRREPELPLWDGPAPMQRAPLALPDL